MAKTQYHPVIYSYLKKYQEDPSSRIFAPLAEAYRKAGLVDEAIDIAREGLKIHPTFVGGRVALARALFDKKSYAEVIDELQQVTEDVPDNLVAQKLIAESYLMQGRVLEALGAYKMLLYFAPQDTESAKLVHELEAQAYEGGSLLLQTDSAPQPLPAFEERSLGSAMTKDPKFQKNRWVAEVEFLQSLLQKVERNREDN